MPVHVPARPTPISAKDGFTMICLEHEIARKDRGEAKVQIYGDGSRLTTYEDGSMVATDIDGKPLALVTYEPNSGVPTFSMEFE
jgi:hypothetical protein